jgi:hypothetical protein
MPVLAVVCFVPLERIQTAELSAVIPVRLVFTAMLGNLLALLVWLDNSAWLDKLLAHHARPDAFSRALVHPTA